MMKKLAIAVAASVIATAAYAQSTTVIHKEGTDSGTTVRRSVDVDSPSVVEKRKVTTTGTVGCSTKTVQKTDDFGDTKVKQKTKC
ncbi:MAG TPA: hypothetical protein VKA39_10000 [Beijerinckiaceae bacterium]|jgi:hypothetical protein|nr:hypothetical protein [Beijerinckiaceae bacterium]